VHVDRAAPAVAPAGAWHLVATRLESFLAPDRAITPLAAEAKA
jgi:hypothetical protein